MIPTFDPWCIKWMYRLWDLRDSQTTHKLMHMADSFGRPGEFTEGGRKYRQTADALAEHNLLGILYCIQNGWLDASEVDLSKAMDAVKPGIIRS